MTTYRRICIEDYTVRDDANDAEITFKRGEEYLTSKVYEEERMLAKVCVFSTYWVWVPVEIFAGAVKFT